MQFIKVATHYYKYAVLLFSKKNRLDELDDALKTSLTLGLQCMSKPAAPAIINSSLSFKLSYDLHSHSHRLFHIKLISKHLQQRMIYMSL